MSSSSLNGDNKESRSLIIGKPNAEKEIAVPDVIKSEVNFLVLPFFALWDKDVRRKVRTEYKTSVRRKKQKLELSWIVVSNPEFGYPGPFDRAVYKAIEQIISALPTPIQNPIPLGSLYSLCKRMGIRKFGGSQYKKIKEALRRIMATSIISEGIFYHKGEEQWVEDSFHLVDRIVFKGRRLPNGEIADTNYIFLNSWYIDNINSRYVKPIDWNHYKSLKTPVAQRLYELLGVKFYGLLTKKGRFISYRYSTLCSLLPITQQRYISKAKETLDPAHGKLEETGFLERCVWKELSRKENDWLIRYYPGKRAREEIKRFGLGEQLELELPPPKEEKASDGETGLSDEQSKIAGDLIQRGITGTTAGKLVKDYPIDQIQRQMDVFDWLKQRNSPMLSKNPAGFLRKSIEEDYQPPEEYLSYKETESQRQREQDRKERWLQRRDELIKQDIATWNKTSPDDRIKGRLDAWIFTQSPKPTPEQIEVKRQELIDDLPQTDEEKWEYISRNYPEDPPTDFE